MPCRESLSENGHVIRQWDGDDRYNRYYNITDLGAEYLIQIQERKASQYEVDFS